MKTILIITYNFPPDGGPAVQRVAKFVKYLNYYGYKTIILTSKHKKRLLDETLLKDIPTKTVVYKSIDIGDYLPGEVRNKLLKNILIPDKQLFWNKTALKIANKILSKHKVDVIFTTSPPHSVHLIGYEIKKKFNIPWIADFRDEWTMNPSFSDNTHKQHNKELEKMVIEKSDHIVVTTQTAQNNFVNFYGYNKVSLIRNGYDREDFEGIDKFNFDYVKDNNSLNLLYFGRLSFSKKKTPSSTHNINCLLQAIREVSREKNDIPYFFEPKVTVLGKNDKNQWLKEFRDLENNLNFLPYKPHKECLAFAQKADVLLLLATSMNKTEFFPAKVFEYIKSREPILAIVSKYGELTSFLESYGNSYIVLENDIDSLKRKLLELMKMKMNNELKLSDNFEFINHYDRKNQVKDLLRIIEKVIE